MISQPDVVRPSFEANRFKNKIAGGCARPRGVQLTQTLIQLGLFTITLISYGNCAMYKHLLDAMREKRTSGQRQTSLEFMDSRID